MPHGGRRPGAGQKPKYGVAMQTVCGRMTPLQREIFRKLGGFAWLRQILEEGSSGEPGRGKKKR